MLPLGIALLTVSFQSWKAEPHAGGTVKKAYNDAVMVEIR